MDKRYCLKEMKAIWEEQNKFACWLLVEVAVCEAQEKYGYIPVGTTSKIKSSAKFTVERIEEIEAVTHHDLIAFTKAVMENLGDEGKYLHYGVTSYDIEDTAMALRLKQSADLITADLEALLEVIRKLAIEHKLTLMIGRTHGVHAEPITFGFKMAVWYSQIQRDIARTEQAREDISYGKISGAVGIYANIDPRIEQYVCDLLGLKPAPVSTQIVQRDRHAQFMTTLGICASSLDNYATEMRNLQRTEILEVQEMFLPGQRGSSAMPHKRNPWRFETICGLSRVVRANAFPAMEDIVSWHERDNTNSSTERVIIPDSCLLVDFMSQSLTKLMGRLEVNKDNMIRNLEKMGGLVFSEKVMLTLVDHGMEKDDAYVVVQENGAKAWAGEDFRTVLGLDPRIAGTMTNAELDGIFDYQHHVRNIDVIFERLGIV
ncbi:MAG: adenylosuccinate lyase [bacterium]|nr:adenylosuccinate lyase [bacterium]